MNIESFMVTIVYHPRLASPFSSCIYKAAYFIEISLYSQNTQSLCEINSLLLSTFKVVIKYLPSASTCSSHNWNISIKLSISYKYKVHVFQVCLHVTITV